MKVISVKFKESGRAYYFDPKELEIKEGEFVIVETARGVEMGEVVLANHMVEDGAVVQPLKKVIRVATDKDMATVERHKKKEKETFAVCEKAIAEHGLDMKLVDVEYTFDGNKILFYFTADGRVDFRELVKDLAAVFRTRIELRQIGVRDEAKMLGGIGSCGRPLCCSTFLGDFEPVSIRMAKDQNLSLNPAKISGICGRLMCCLKYENHMYCCKEGGCKRNCGNDRVEIPKLGSLVVTPLGEGKVTGINRAMRTASVQLTPDNVIQVEWDEIVDASKADPI